MIEITLRVRVTAAQVVQIARAVILLAVIVGADRKLTSKRR